VPPLGPRCPPPPWRVVRICRVRPRALNLPFTLPLRILQLNTLPNHNLDGMVRDIFGGYAPDVVDPAMLARSSADWSAPMDWRTVDVVHIDALPAFDSRRALLTMAEPERVGTLGWFARTTDRWQTRLLAVHCASAEECGTAGSLAQALWGKGNPAVLVVGPAGTAPARSVEHFFTSFYNLLIHDYALDAAHAASPDADVTATLFAGGGREEAIRVSNVGVLLLDLMRDVAPAQKTFGIALPRANEFLRAELSSIEGLWKNSTFKQHEGGGLLPLAAELERLRRAVIPAFERRSFQPAQAAERFVSPSLWSETAGKLEVMEPAAAALRAGAMYQLGIQIGAPDVRPVVINAVAIFEEVFKWSPDSKGVWVEIGVSGIDFAVIGDPVQELWLPRTGDSDAIYFTVSPRVAGVAQLRFGLYYRNNRIQSFRLAALTQPPEGGAAEQR